MLETGLQTNYSVKHSTLASDRAVVNPDALMADNRSAEAFEGRSQWEDARRSGHLIGVWSCADSRVIIPTVATHRVRSIAAGGPERFTRVFRDPGISTAVILAHFAGPVEAGEYPKGCGGLNAKASYVAREDAQGLDRFLGELASSDPLVQAWVSASRTAEETGKPVLAAIQDHLDGGILPVAVFEGSGRRITTAIPVQHMLEGQYDASKIYGQGIPVLAGNEVPDPFNDFLAEDGRRVSAIHDRFPNLSEMQQVQNPEAVVISTESRPLQVCFPRTFERPGSAFKLSVPRPNIDATLAVSDNEISVVVAQAEYPITSCNKSNGESGSGFSDTNVVFIETPSLELSRRIAGALMDQKWMQTWQRQHERRILLGQVREGIAHQIVDLNNLR